MFEIICDSCGETIGNCSKDLTNETVYCEECTPLVDEDEDEVIPEAEEKATEEEEEKA